MTEKVPEKKDSMSRKSITLKAYNNWPKEVIEGYLKEVDDGGQYVVKVTCKVCKNHWAELSENYRGPVVTQARN